MKTPEEIKKGLECLLGMCEDADCDECSRNVYEAYEIIRDDHIKDALTCIRQLEAENSRKDDTIQNLTELLNAAHDETAVVRREKNAAKKDLYSCQPCFACSHFRHNGGACRGANECFEKMGECAVEGIEYVGVSFMWRGVCPENTEVQGDA